MNPRTIVRHASILLLALAAISAAGCEGGATGAEDGQGGGADDGGDDDGTPDPKPVTCAKPTQGPTQHDYETIEEGAEVVWKADASPPRITYLTPASTMPFFAGSAGGHGSMRKPYPSAHSA